MKLTDRIRAQQRVTSPEELIRTADRALAELDVMVTMCRSRFDKLSPEGKKAVAALAKAAVKALEKGIK